jgi:hypothetical protein
MSNKLMRKKRVSSEWTAECLLLSITHPCAELLLIIQFRLHTDIFKGIITVVPVPSTSINRFLLQEIHDYLQHIKCKEF